MEPTPIEQLINYFMYVAQRVGEMASQYLTKLTGMSFVDAAPVLLLGIIVLALLIKLGIASVKVLLVLILCVVLVFVLSQFVNLTSWLH
jgi:hypothetical protein